METGSFWAGVLQQALANWLGVAMGAVIGGLVAWWGKHSASWSWPAIVVVGIVVFAASLFIYDKLAGWKSASGQLTSKEWSIYKKESVLNKTFRNERVVLDGKSFSGCTFQNVTFEYNGTAPFDLVKNNIYGSYILDSKNDEILLLLRFLKEFRYLKDDIKILGHNE